MNTPEHSDRSLAAYHERRILAALPRWKHVADLRTQGFTFQRIADKLGIDVAFAHRLEVKYRAWRMRGTQPANSKP
jgi:hypothetical protein